jgi:transcriptional regulator with XRE-family HTH domain
VKDKALINLGKNINRLRVASSITQEQLAERANLSRRFIQELEAGEKGPTLPTLARLRIALKTAWDDLLRGI